MKLVIVVPIYNEEFSFFEQIAWRQLLKVLGCYHISIVMPEKMRSICNQFEKYTIETFSNKFFESPQTYSQLLMSTSFYERFLDYDYMLIYQLDAFVFSNQFEYFCSLGYDYIGAPWARWTNYWHSIRIRPGRHYLPFRPRVGNGGFSLRRVSAMLRILARKDEILLEHPLARLFKEQEDMFFAYCGTLKDGLNIPNIDLAQKFSVEMDVGYCYRNLENCLPFGCHAWHKIAFPVWKNIIESEGYDLTLSDTGKDFKFFRRIVLSFYLMERMLRAQNRERAQLVISSILVRNSYSIWGVGKYGKLLLLWLQNAGIKIDCAFDSRAKKTMKYYDVPIVKPKYSLVKKYRRRLIVGTVDYKEDIICELKDIGFQREDFMTMEEFINLLLSTY